MAEAEARLVGTIEEWKDLGNGHELSYIHAAAELLANDLVQLLAHNKELRTRLQAAGNRLSLSLVIRLDPEDDPKPKPEVKLKASLN